VVLEGGGPNIFFSISNSFFWIGSKWISRVDGVFM